MLRGGQTDIMWGSQLLLVLFFCSLHETISCCTKIMVETDHRLECWNETKTETTVYMLPPGLQTEGTPQHCCCPWGRMDGINSHFCWCATILHSVDLTNTCMQFDTSACDDRHLFMLHIQTLESADPCRERTVEMVLSVFFLCSVFPSVFVF